MMTAPTKSRSLLHRLLRGTAWLGLTAVVLLAMLTLPGLALHRLAAERDALLAELDSNEPGWRWDDLVPAKVPDEQNGALRVLEIARLLPPQWRISIPEELDAKQPNTFNRPRARYTKDYIAYLGRELDKVKPARGRLTTLHGLTTGDYGWDHAADNGKGGVFMAAAYEKGIPEERLAARGRV